MYIAIIGKAGEHRQHSPPTEVPKRASQQFRINFLLRIWIKSLLNWHIHQIEKVEQTNPGDAGPIYAAQRTSILVVSVALGEMKDVLEHSQTDGEMNS